MFTRLSHDLREWRRERLRAELDEGGRETTLESFLESFVASFFEEFGEEERRGRLQNLFHRETENLHLPAAFFREEVVRPVFEICIPALQRLAAPIDARSAELCVELLIGQLLQLRRLRDGRLDPALESAATDRELQRGVVLFAAAGIRAFAAASANGGAPVTKTFSLE